MKSNRLFTAITFPQPIVEQLQKLQPKPDKNIRITPPEKLHITFNYVGNADLEQVKTALKQIDIQTAIQPLKLTIERLGKSSSSGRGTIIWAEIQKNLPLEKLQAQINTVLVAQGLKVDSRKFKPHITLARCKRGTPREAIDKIIQQQIPDAMADISINDFGLYNSVNINGEDKYILLR